VASKQSKRPATAETGFEVQALLDAVGAEGTTVRYARGETIFTQGAGGHDVVYIQAGGVTLSVLSKRGTESVVAVLAAGDFLGEGCLAGQPRRMATATARSPSVVVLIGTASMRRLLHKQPVMADRFIAHLLRRNIRIEEDLIDQLVGSTG
jgi:CRP/FNR family cyclic AMP-dependent transcriptional regulator